MLTILQAHNKQELNGCVKLFECSMLLFILSFYKLFFISFIRLQQGNMNNRICTCDHIFRIDLSLFMIYLSPLVSPFFLWTRTKTSIVWHFWREREIDEMLWELWFSVILKQGWKRPLYTPKRMIERERKVEGEI